MEVVLAHPDVRGLRHRMLATADAHGLYRGTASGNWACRRPSGTEKTPPTASERADTTGKEFEVRNQTHGAGRRRGDDIAPDDAPGRVGRAAAGRENGTLRDVTRSFLDRRGTGRHFTSVAEELGRLVGIASLEVFERLPYPANLSGKEGYVLNVHVEPAF
jgi:hypothetical protein